MTILAKSWSASLSCMVSAALAAGCAQPRMQQAASTRDADQIEAAFVVQGAGPQAIARVVTRAAACPMLAVDGKPQAMQVRAAPAVIAARGAGAQPDSKEAAFPVLT